jgi:hypothetical protein
VPGAYAHVTLVNLIREPGRLGNHGFTPEAIVPILIISAFANSARSVRIILTWISVAAMLRPGRIGCITKVPVT